MPVIFPHRQMLDQFEMWYGSRAGGDAVEVYSAFQTQPALCRFVRNLLDVGASYTLLADWRARYDDFALPVQVTPTLFFFDINRPVVDGTHWGARQHAGDIVWRTGNYGAKSVSCGNYFFEESKMVFAPDHDMDDVAAWGPVNGGVIAQVVADRVQGTGCISLTTANLWDGMIDLPAAVVDCSGDDFFAIWAKCDDANGVLRVQYTDNAARTAHIDLAINTADCWERFIWNKANMVYSNVNFSWANVSIISLLDAVPGGRVYLVDIHERLQAPARFSAHLNDFSFVTTALYVGRMLDGQLPELATGVDGDLYVKNRLEVYNEACFQSPVRFNAVNGARMTLQSISELVTIPIGQGAAGVVSAANLAPAGSMIFGVSFRVTQAPGGGATTLDIGRTNQGNLDEFIDGAPCAALGNTGGMFVYHDAFTTSPVFNNTNNTFTLTTDVNVAGVAMIVRVVVSYWTITAPTS